MAVWFERVEKCAPLQAFVSVDRVSLPIACSQALYSCLALFTNLHTHLVIWKGVEEELKKRENEKLKTAGL